MRYVSHFTSGNFFVFESVPYSLTYAVKFFTSVKRKGKANLRLIDALRLVSPLLSQLSLHGFLWAVNSLSAVSRQLPASSPHNRYSIFLFFIFISLIQHIKKNKVIPTTLVAGNRRLVAKNRTPADSSASALSCIYRNLFCQQSAICYLLIKRLQRW